MANSCLKLTQKSRRTPDNRFLFYPSQGVVFPLRHVTRAKILHFVFTANNMRTSDEKGERSAAITLVMPRCARFFLRFSSLTRIACHEQSNKTNCKLFEVKSSTK